MIVIIVGRDIVLALITLLMNRKGIAPFTVTYLGKAATFNLMYAFPFILIGIGLLASYFLLGTIQSAGQLLQLEQFDEAEKRINLTWKPEWLYKTNRHVESSSFPCTIRAQKANNFSSTNRK